MIYSEAAYFDGAHVQHIADYYEMLRLKRKGIEFCRATRNLPRYPRLVVDNG